jgi:NADPH-dependent curcumin reductase CurA
MSIDIGAVMRGVVVAEVIESRGSKFKRGDIVTGSVGWQQYGVLDEKHATLLR